MRRNMELIGKMVLAIDDAPTCHAPEPLEIAGYTESEIAGHAYLLVEAGLAEGKKTTTLQSTHRTRSLTRLTWAGHDFADAARNETTWRTTIAWIGEKAGTVAFDVLKQALSATAMKELGIG